MYKSYFDMHLLVDRFLSDELDDVEKSRFEERICWDKELLDEVHLAERLREGMKASAVTTSARADDERPGIFDFITDLFAVPQYAAAASFVLAAVLTAGILMNSLGGDQTSLDYDGWGTDTVLETVSYQLFSVRGAGEQQLELDADTWTVFEVDAVPSCTRYRTTLRSAEDSGESWRRQLSLKPNFQQVLAIGLPTHDLEVGRYVLEVEGTDARSGTQCDHKEQIGFEITAKN